MAEPSRIPDWSSLPGDLLTAVFRLLDAPSALAYGGVCTAWRAAAAGVTFARTPWLVSWEPDLDDCGEGPTRTTLRCLLGAEGASFQTAPFPRGRSLRCCGASHGWLVGSDERSNLVLYNPFAPPSAANFIPLPPVTGFECVVTDYSTYGDCGIGAYVDGEYQGFSPVFFYQKAILSCAPSPVGADGAAYTVAVIHCDRRSLSFAKAGDTKWRRAWTISHERMSPFTYRVVKNGEYATLNFSAFDVYHDVVHHDGRFYTVTLRGVVESWDLSGPDTEPRKEVIGTFGYAGDAVVLARHLVSTPWGDLLQVRTLFTQNVDKYPQGVRVCIGKIIPNGHRLVELRPAKALQGHAVFLGLNHSACVHPDEFPGLKPNCVYFTSPTFVADEQPWCYVWSGVKIYNLKNNMAEDVFHDFHDNYFLHPPPAAVWIIPTRRHAELICCSSFMNLSLGD
ncbi:unnamed protein product [Urochloa humidicola]